MLEKRRTSQLSEAEEKELQHLMNSGELYEFASEEEKEDTRQRIHSRIFSSIDVNKVVENSGQKRPNRLYQYIAAASVLLIAFAAFYLFQNKLYQKVIISSAGSIKEYHLPDGSTIWLNKNSSLSYAENFSDHRAVTLTKGEAFFQVKKDAAHPFTVLSNNITTTVKGTSFSVSMLPNANTVNVSVVTGRVAVSKERDTFSVLFPQQRVRYHLAKDYFTKDSVTSAEARGWIEGDIVMQRASLEELASFLQINYNVSVTNQIHKNERQYYVHLSSGTSLQDALSILNLLVKKEGVHFTMKNEAVVIEPLR